MQEAGSAVATSGRSEVPASSCRPLAATSGCPSVRSISRLPCSARWPTLRRRAFRLPGLEDQFRRPRSVRTGEVAAVELGEPALEPHVEGLGRSREAGRDPSRLLALQVRDGRLPVPGAHEPDLLPGDAQPASQIIVLFPARTGKLLQEPPPPLLPAREDGTREADTRTRQNSHAPLCQMTNRQPAARASLQIIFTLK